MKDILDSQKIAFYQMIKAFNDVNALNHIIIIGSWAEHIYEESNQLNFVAALKTQKWDIDFIKSLHIGMEH